MTTLSVRGVSRRYGSVFAIRDVTLDAGSGELISLLGPSGCGKSTMLRVIAGFEKPDGGAVILDGQDVTRLLPERRNIGMVFQDYALFPHLTVAANCLFGLQMRRVKRAEAARRLAEVLDIVQLTGREASYPRELSGGQRQRVALARALVIEPAILLLDEPLANLDAVLRDEMRFFIRSLQQRVGITTLCVTHDQSEALLMSDRVAVMFEGQVAQLGTPRAIYDTPATKRVASFVGSSNLIGGTVRAIEGAFVTVETALGPLAARHDGSVRVGEPATVMVRPESVTLEPPQGERINQLACTVHQTFFMGSGVDLRLAARDGTVLQALLNPRHAPAAGQAVTAYFPADTAWTMIA